jgi:hypothetical protein
MYTKQHGTVYLVFAWMHGLLPIYVIIVGKTNRKSCKRRTMMTYFNDDKITLLLRKQVYPNEYFDLESKFT